jgi:CRISPR-associated protein Cas2
VGQNALWYLVAYDIRDPKRWRKAYRIINGYGRPLQYSLFRCRLAQVDLERLRWELERVLDEEDSLLFVGLCTGCVDRIAVRNRSGQWADEPPRTQVL